MVERMKEIGSIIICMVKDPIPGRMGESTRGNILMIRNM